MEWISIKEIFPNDGDEVLTFDPGYGMVVCYVRGKKLFYVQPHDYDIDFTEGITHWMPLPKDPVNN